MPILLLLRSLQATWKCVRNCWPPIGMSARFTQNGLTVGSGTAGGPACPLARSWCCSRPSTLEERQTFQDKSINFFSANPRSVSGIIHTTTLKHKGLNKNIIANASENIFDSKLWLLLDEFWKSINEKINIWEGWWQIVSRIETEFLILGFPEHCCDY